MVLNSLKSVQSILSGLIIVITIFFNVEIQLILNAAEFLRRVLNRLCLPCRNQLTETEQINRPVQFASKIAVIKRELQIARLKVMALVPFNKISPPSANNGTGGRPV